ncbi:hypothetical protein Rsub_09643 [Raphidocelis subcapitata]|uniref:CAF17 C-terminal domain-containing protein n=1 Tax=Raphidocelis subcapitata TaxID=307507 RepID=A0A2V0PHQ5_9CHLO|nr:hypothetical protein Rsub_09643 [Raphidocelis subcapitata]|eukprot:GBF96787.1 hypothetical protein Rsub_09643 [Raphidocelis subcapitata]
MLSRCRLPPAWTAATDAAQWLQLAARGAADSGAPGVRSGGGSGSGAPAAAPPTRCRALHTSRALAEAASSGADADAAAPFATRLSCRSVIVMEGEGGLAFLQGLVTNDVRPLASPGAGPVYAALVTPKGKLLHDLFVFRGDESAAEPGTHSAGSGASSSGGSGGSGDGGAEAPPRRLLLDVDGAGAAAVVSWLSRYRLRRPIRLEHAGGDLAVWARYGAGNGSGGGGGGGGSGGGGGPGGGWWPDPRLPGGQLGDRGVFDAAAAPQEAGGGGEAGHRMLRYWHGVPEGDAEMPTERMSPLELNLDALNGVSYTKGCYIGQERNSFTHFRGVIRRRLMPVVLSRPGLPPGSEILQQSGSGGSAGTLLACEGSLGLAHLKLAPALAAAAAATGHPGGGGAALGIAGQEGAWVRPVRPAWWPAEWGHEEDGAPPRPT